MQYDMHYYGTYTLAATAGFSNEEAEIIACSAQFVDDNSFHDWIIAHDGGGIQGIPTAHHPLESGIRMAMPHSGHNECRLIWVPFHFLPSGAGSSFEERMITLPNSRIAKDMMVHFSSNTESPIALYSLGIASHVFMDTFAHYGFSGIQSDRNSIKSDTLKIDTGHSQSIREYIEEKAVQFSSIFGSEAKLGHGAVFTYPDRGYLKYSFQYENGEISERDNTKTYLYGASELYKHFVKACANKPIFKWNEIEQGIKDILQKEATAEERVGFWLDSIENGVFKGVQLPKKYEPDTWNQKLQFSINKKVHSDFLLEQPCLFLKAAHRHRSYVLEDLLPKNGISLV